MDKKKAKEVLLRSRPWSPRKTDEEETAAKLAESESDLRDLQKRQEEFNARVRHELAGIPVPSGLRDQILARKKIVRIPCWRQPRFALAIAAAFIFLAVGTFYWARPREDKTFAGFRSRMVGFAVREYRMDKFTTNMVELRDFLATGGRPADFPLPQELAKVPLKGGARLSWQGQPVSMVCFDWDKKETLYMFVIDAPAAAPPETAAAQLKPLKRLNTATWTAGGKTFVLAGRLPENELAKLVSS